MQSHFCSLLENLTLDELEILKALIDEDSLNRFSARTKKEISIKTNLTDSILRKSITRLEAMNFIEVVAGSREHLLYINEYGQDAIKKITDGSHV